MSSELMELPRRILVVDDNPDIHTVFREILMGETVGERGCDILDGLERDLFGDTHTTVSKDTYDVECALQGQEGLKKVEQALSQGHPFMVAFVDMRMPPGWDGLETIEHLWKADPDIQVIICTAYADYSWKEIVQRLGKTDKLLLLKKPFDPAEVAQVATALVHKWIWHRQAIMRMVELEAARAELALLNQNLEQRVEERTADVERLLRQKNELIGRLGHDLKNPLTPLLTLLPLLSEEQESSQRQEMIDAAIHSAKYLHELTVKTMRLAKLNSVNDESTLNIEDISLAQHIRDNLARRELAAKEKGVIMKSNVDEAIIVRADRLMVQELLDNLVANAIKYSPTGGTITFDAMIQEDKVKVSVRDTGIGMNKEQLAHVFEEFYRADRSSKDSDSIGLGLAICKRIVEQHGGRIWAESEGSGKGSSFYFTISKSICASKDTVFAMELA